MDYAKLYEDLKVLFSAVADKIGTGADFAWDIVVKQQTTEGVGMLIGAVLAYIGAAYMSGIAQKCKLKSQKERETHGRYGDSGEWAAGQFFSALFGLAIAAWGSWLLIHGVMHIMNPEFYAIEFFVNLVKPAIPQ